MLEMETTLVLLGAGASKEAGISTAVEMTAEVMNLIERDYDGKITNALRFVHGGLQMRRGIQNKNTFEPIDIEELVAAVELLEAREDSEIAPFVAQWHTAIAELDRVDPESDSWTLSRLADSLGEYVGSLETDRYGKLRSRSFSADHFLRELFWAIQNSISGNSKHIFSSTRRTIIQKLKTLAWLDEDDATDYLAPLIESGRNRTLTVATLNYDNTVELAASKIGLSCSTGISGWAQKGLFDLPKKGIQLLKLHGAINWKITSQRIKANSREPIQHLPHDIIEELERKDMIRHGNYNPALVFGGSKLTSKGPYLELLRTFSDRLNLHQHLLVIGYSFGDEHINESIYTWLMRDSTTRITIIDAPGAEPSSNYFAANFGELLDKRLLFLGTGAGEGIRRLYA